MTAAVDALTRCSGLELAKAIRSGQVRAIDVVEAHIPELERTAWTHALAAERFDRKVTLHQLRLGLAQFTAVALSELDLFASWSDIAAPTDAARRAGDDLAETIGDGVLVFNLFGLPTGVQIVAAPGKDHVSIAAALELERALGGWVDPSDMERSR